MKIYTKTGDDGSSSLFGGQRISKSNQRLHAYGTLDELNALLGVCRAMSRNTVVEKTMQPLATVQSMLFVIGSHLATPYKLPSVPAHLPALPARAVEEMECLIDELQQELPALTHFILPGGELIAAQLHVARTVCRRAERDIVLVHEQESILPHILGYINRLSDYLFMLARSVNHQLGTHEQIWEK